MFTTVTIGDIADERARELYLEEWRQPELTRISWCLARSGQPDDGEKLIICLLGISRVVRI